MAAPSANMLFLTAGFDLLGTDARVTECRDMLGDSQRSTSGCTATVYYIQVQSLVIAI